MLVAARAAVLALLAVLAVGVSPAEAQLWKPAKKPAVVAPTKPARTRPVRTKPARRAARPSRATPRHTVVRDDPPPPPRARPRADAGDSLPEFDDAPVIVVDVPTRTER